MTDDVKDTLQWIEDWRKGMFSSTSRDKDGWPIEMHGLVLSYEKLAIEKQQLQKALRVIREATVALDIVSAERDRYRAALREIESVKRCCGCADDIDETHAIARAALEGEGE